MIWWDLRRMLRDIECAADRWRLRVGVDDAARMIHAVGVGVGLTLLAAGDAERDFAVPALTREAILAAVTTDTPRPVSRRWGPDLAAPSHAPSPSRLCCPRRPTPSRPSSAICSRSGSIGSAGSVGARRRGTAPAIPGVRYDRYRSAIARHGHCSRLGVQTGSTDC